MLRLLFAWVLPIKGKKTAPAKKDNQYRDNTLPTPEQSILGVGSEIKGRENQAELRTRSSNSVSKI